MQIQVWTLDRDDPILIAKELQPYLLSVSHDDILILDRRYIVINKTFFEDHINIYVKVR